MMTSKIALVVLVLLSSLFSMAEMALASARKIKLQILVEEGNKNAAKVLKLQEKPGRFFTAIQIGVNIVAILAGIISDGVFNPFFVSILQTLNLASLAPTIAPILSFLLITTIVIEFSDLIPKRIAMIYPEKIALVIVSPMIVLVTLLYPLIVVFDGCANLLLRLFRLQQNREDNITYEEISAVMAAGALAGVVDEKEHHLIENVFELESRWVTSAMTIRDDIIYFTLQESEKAIRDKIAQNPHSKYLVCERKLDSVVGYVDAKDILTSILKNEQESCLENIEKICNKNILVIPNTLTLSDVLDKFNEKCEDFAVIINEYALIVGVISLSDVMSTVLGDVGTPLQDELIIKRSETSWLIDGTTPIEDVGKALKIEAFPEQDSYETLAGFLMLMLKSIPKKAATVAFEGFQFEVMDVDNYKIDQVLVNVVDPSQIRTP